MLSKKTHHRFQVPSSAVCGSSLRSTPDTFRRSGQIIRWPDEWNRLGDEMMSCFVASRAQCWSSKYHEWDFKSGIIIDFRHTMCWDVSMKRFYFFRGVCGMNRSTRCAMDVETVRWVSSGCGIFSLSSIAWATTSTRRSIKALSRRMELRGHLHTISNLKNIDICCRRDIHVHAIHTRITPHRPENSNLTR